MHNYRRTYSFVPWCCVYGLILVVEGGRGFLGVNVYCRISVKTAYPDETNTLVVSLFSLFVRERERERERERRREGVFKHCKERSLLLGLQGLSFPSKSWTGVAGGRGWGMEKEKS